MPLTTLPDIRAFLLEDSALDADLIRMMLVEKKSGRVELEQAERLSAGLERLSQNNYDVILCDLNLPDSWGLNTFRKVHEAFPDIPVIILTGHDDTELATYAMQEGAQDYLIKGDINRQGLLKALRYAIDRQKILRELMSSVAEIKRLERERESMLSLFAHDIRNALAPVAGFLRRILDGKRDHLQDRLKRMLDEILATERLAASFLDFTRLDAGKYAPAAEVCDLDALIRREIELATSKAEQKNIAISYTPGAHMPAVDADSAMLSRVVANLLDNAVKYSGEGGAVAVQTDDARDEVLVEVRDSGRGIPFDRLPFVFDAFYRVSGDQKGSGLGLTISRKIVEAHGGRIWADSTPGKCSVFSFSLPKYGRGDKGTRSPAASGQSVVPG